MTQDIEQNADPTVFRAVIDPDKCQLYALCVGINPDIFDIPAGSRFAVVLREIRDADDLADVEEAVRACPAQAIRLVREDRQAST